MIRRLLKTSRATKKVLLGITDFVGLYVVIFLILFASDQNIVRNFISLFFDVSLFPLCSLLVFYCMGVYSSILRYIDFSAIYLLSSSIFISLVISFFVYFSFSVFDIKAFYSSFENVSPQIFILGIPMFFFFIIGSRLIAYLVFSDRSSGKRVIIYGAGSAGIQLSEALRVSHEFKPIAFVDSDKSLHDTFLGGLKVLPPKKIRKLVARNKIDEVLIAMPSVSKSTLRSLLREIESFSVKVRILPGLAELAQGKISVSELKEVDITDLLGRSEVAADKELINKNIKDQVVLVTGAGGSIGSEISRQVSQNNPRKLILVDANEYALYAIKNELSIISPSTKVYSILASVTNKNRMTEVYKAFKVDTIYHAAAYKHVPIVEENPFEAVFNNIIGTQACVQAAIDAEVETFVLISTDKAVRPTNIMGATKRFAEMILQSLSDQDDIKNKTRITMVRFGNVIGSSGSAIPLFQQQIKDGGPVTVTHSEVIRYFMSISEAAELVIQAGAMGKGGDVFVLDMGEPVKIYELAKRLIRLSGMELKNEDNPDGDIEIIFTGLRPGEKLYEELLIGDNVSTTEHKRILRAEEDFLTEKEIDKYLGLLKEIIKKGDVESLKEILKEVVSGYTPDNQIVDVLYLQKNN